jgi:hypothetical protein
MKPTEVTFEAAGKTYRLCFSMNALCAIEEATGSAVSDLDLNRLTTVRLFVWAGLQDHHPEVKDVKGAGVILDAVGVKAAVELVAGALGAAMSVEGGGNPPTAAAGS